MKLYVGARDYRPEGFVTVDISADQNPDIVADIRDLSPIETDSCDEIVAGAVLEHIDWPDGFLALSEFARVLKIGGILKVSVPDMDLMVRMLLSGDSAWHIMGLVYGVGGRENTFEQHRYGYTVGMLVDVFETLGFGEINWWHSDMSDAANGWVPRWNRPNAAISLNLSARKIGQPAVPVRPLYEELRRRPLDDFMSVASTIREAHGPQPRELSVPKLHQLIHFQLIDARQRIKYLEDMNAGLTRNAEAKKFWWRRRLSQRA